MPSWPTDRRSCCSRETLPSSSFPFPGKRSRSTGAAIRRGDSGLEALSWQDIQRRRILNKPITVLAPTGTLGYGFGLDALERGMSLEPSVIAVDAGSTDPGPHYLGSGEPLVSRFSLQKELRALIKAAHSANIPLIVGSAGGAGSRAHVDWTVEIVKDVFNELGLKKKVAWIYSDISKDRVKGAI